MNSYFLPSQISLLKNRKNNKNIPLTENSLLETENHNIPLLFLISPVTLGLGAHEPDLGSNRKLVV